MDAEAANADAHHASQIEQTMAAADGEEERALAGRAAPMEIPEEMREDAISAQNTLPPAYPTEGALAWCAQELVEPMTLPALPNHDVFNSVPLDAMGNTHIHALGMDGPLMRKLFGHPENIANHDRVIGLLADAFQLTASRGLVQPCQSLTGCTCPHSVVEQLAKCYHHEMHFFYLCACSHQPSRSRS